MHQIPQGLDRGITNKWVLSAMEAVPRHEFVSANDQARAYGDHPLPIGYGQTISQPYMVAAMTELLEPKSSDRVLEIGTGSGYQTAILAELVAEVYTVEIVEPLAKRAHQTFEKLGISNVHAKIADGHEGWPEAAPFDAIIVTCAPESTPEKLIDQLKSDGGKLVIPLGAESKLQRLCLFEKHGDGQLTKKDVMAVRFVPMTS